MNVRPAALLLLTCTTLLAALAGCGGDKKSLFRPPAATRTYFMGFSSFPPKPSVQSIVETIDAFAPHSDAALIVTEPPWDRSWRAGRPIR